jgi:recombination protein RecA
VDQGLVEKSGTWLSFGGERMGQGRENARVFLKENKDVRDKLEAALRKKLEIAAPSGSSASAAGPNGHAGAHSQGEKTSAKAASATSSAARRN